MTDKTSLQETTAGETSEAAQGTVGHHLLPKPASTATDTTSKQSSSSQSQSQAGIDDHVVSAILRAVSKHKDTNIHKELVKIAAPGSNCPWSDLTPKVFTRPSDSGDGFEARTVIIAPSVRKHELSSASYSYKNPHREPEDFKRWIKSVIGSEAFGQPEVVTFGVVFHETDEDLAKYNAEGESSETGFMFYEFEHGRSQMWNAKADGWKPSPSSVHD